VFDIFNLDRQHLLILLFQLFSLSFSSSFSHSLSPRLKLLPKFLSIILHTGTSLGILFSLLTLSTNKVTMINSIYTVLAMFQSCIIFCGSGCGKNNAAALS
jgi:lipoprotein signal peptidase